jgi:hypothetical protein
MVWAGSVAAFPCTGVAVTGFVVALASVVVTDSRKRATRGR